MSEDAHKVEKITGGGRSVILKIEIPANIKEGERYVERLRKESGIDVSFVGISTTRIRSIYTRYSVSVEVEGAEEQIDLVRSKMAKIVEDER